MLARVPAAAKGVGDATRAGAVALGLMPRLWAHAFSAGPSKPPSDDAAEAAGIAAAAEAAAAADAAAAAARADADAAATATGASSSTASPSSSASASSAAGLGDYDSYLPKLVVFGGAGFVGSRVCQQGLAMGASVGDALDPQRAWKDVLKGASGVVSTLGTFGSNEQMYRICGEANMRLMDAAAEAGVPRFAFISVADFKFPGGWHAQDFLLKGYFQGKRDAEQHLAALFPSGGVALRPSFIYGSRAVGGASVPLGLVGAPLKAALSVLPTKTLAGIPILGAAFVPPLSVDTVAKAAVNAVLDSSVPAGTMDVWDMDKFA
ncbi:hypothetical protein ACK3TF_002892 [Chlorella vulgaris]